MTNAAQKWLSAFDDLPRKAQKDVLISLLRLPIEIPYTAPSNDQLRRAANAVFLDIDRSETQIEMDVRFGQSA